jgi:hypothetical protein
MWHFFPIDPLCQANSRAAQAMEKVIEDRAKRKASGAMLPEDSIDVITEWL